MKTCKWSLLAIVFVLAGCSTPYNAVTKTAKVLWDRISRLDTLRICPAGSV